MIKKKIGEKIVYHYRNTKHYITIKSITTIKTTKGEKLKMINNKYLYDCDYYREPTKTELSLPELFL